MRKHIINLCPQIIGDQFALPVVVDLEIYHRMMSQAVLHNAEKFKVEYCQRPHDEE